MVSKHFWLKCILSMIAVMFVSSLGLAIWTAQQNAELSNQSLLKELKSQASHYQKAIKKEWQTLATHLVESQTQTNPTRSAFFSFYGVFDPVTRHTLRMVPASHSGIAKALKKLPSDSYPVMFSVFRQSSKNPMQVLFLVNTQQIQMKSLPQHLKNKILFGVLNRKGLEKLSLPLVKEKWQNAFILDSNYHAILSHTQAVYSGYVLPKNSVFRTLYQKHPQGWNTLVPSERILTSSIKMGISNSYLVLSKPMWIWHQFFLGLWQEMVVIMTVMSLAAVLVMFFFFHPLQKAYQYLSWLLNRYASYHTFPIPDHAGSNPYIVSVQPWLKKIFWKLREEKLLQKQDAFEDVQYFSEMVNNLTQEIEEKHTNIVMHLDLKADISLPQQKNWIRQAILEVLKNAVECMNFKGKIDIYTFEEDQVFWCVIRDYGPGMSREVMDQACDAYYSSKANANGLGLALAKSALSKVGSTVRLKNADDGKQGLMVQIAMPFGLHKTHQVEL